MQTVKLIGYGHAPAIPACELQPGMVRLYNYGYKGVIVKTAMSPGWINYLVQEVGTRRTIDRKQKLGTHIPVLWCADCGGPVVIGRCEHEAGKGLHVKSLASPPDTSGPEARG